MLKKFIYTACMALALVSCTEDIMDEINRDESNPPAEAVPSKFMVTDAITSTAFSTWGGSYAWYAGVYTEQYFGTGNNQYMKAEIRQRSETASSTTYNNEWNGTYANLNNVKQMIEKCSEGGIDVGAYDLRGMAEVLWVLNFEALTDLHGDIPYSEAMNVAVSQPKLDSQENIYKDLLAKTDAAIADLSKAKESKLNNAGAQDILFGGNLDQWLGLAHAVKARLLLNTSFRNPAAIAQVITEGEAALAAGFNGAELTVFNGVSADNPWTAFNWSRQYLGASKTVVDYMDARKDPRLDLYAVPFYGGPAYAAPGDDELATSTTTVGYPAWLENGAASVHLLGLAELHFILAEAKTRQGQDAKANFEAAVKASFDDIATASDEADLASMADDYIASIANVDLTEIMVQKYISMTRGQTIQTYNDIRRCRALGEEHIKLQNPNNTLAGVNQWPYRYAYGNSDVISNPNVAKAFGSGNDAGKYIFTEPVWIFGGSR